MKNPWNNTHSQVINRSKRMFVNPYGQLVIWESEWERFYRSLNIFQIIIGSYLALVTALALIPCFKWLFISLGMTSNTPFAFKAVVCFAIWVKICQGTIFLLNLLTKDNKPPYNYKQRNSIKKLY